MKIIIIAACCFILLNAVNVDAKPPKSSESEELPEYAGSSESEEDAKIVSPVHGATAAPGESTTKAADSSESVGSSEECEDACDKMLLLICGSDGKTTKTFGSPCEMNVASCQEKTNYKKVSDGRCPRGN